MSGFESLLASSPALGLLEGGTTLLTLRERPIATFEAPDELSAVHGRFANPQGLLQMLGALVSVRPSGLLLLTLGSQGAAFRLREGQITAAADSEANEDATRWISEHRRQRDALRRGRHGAHAESTYLAESIHDALNVYSCRHASLMLAEGDVHWVAREFSVDRAPHMSTVLMEHARRTDEIEAIERRIGDLDRLVIPVSEPPAVLLRPVTSDRLDFFDEPDTAAQDEWLDARQLFACAQGMWTVRELMARCRLGSFRTLAAIATLLEREHVTLSDAGAQVQAA